MVWPHLIVQTTAANVDAVRRYECCDVVQVPCVRVKVYFLSGTKSTQDITTADAIHLMI